MQHGPDAAWVSRTGELDIAGQTQFSQVVRQAEAEVGTIVLDLRALRSWTARACA